MSEDSASRPKAEKETRQFQIEEENFVPTSNAGEDKSKAKKEKKGKKEFGKLPQQAKDNAASSRDAAAETLKRMFNRG
jgi:hypothetical protein